MSLMDGWIDGYVACSLQVLGCMYSHDQLAERKDDPINQLIRVKDAKVLKGSMYHVGRQASMLAAQMALVDTCECRFEDVAD